MGVKKMLGLLVFMGILASCNNDDNGVGAEVVPPRLLADQTIEDDAALQEYLQTHFYNYRDFENPPMNFDFKIRIDTITEANRDTVTPLSMQVRDTTFTISSTNFNLSTEENDVPHTLYYLNVSTGAGALPTVADSVYLKYEGFRLDGTVFDSNSGTPIWLDLPGTLSLSNPGTIEGFKKGLPKFRAGGDVIVNNDGTFTVDSPGIGLLFMPSGLAYFIGTQPGEAYAPLIFAIELVVVNTADHDRDGVPSILEDLDGDRNIVNDDTDEDSIPNYVDIDDDGDGTLTVDEDLEPDTDLTVDRDGDGDPENDIGDGNPLNDDTDGDGIPNYLDSDDSASRKGDD